MRQKMSTAINLVRRALTLSDPSFHKKNLKLVLDILTENSFPKHIVSRVIKKDRALHNSPGINQSRERERAIFKRGKKNDIHEWFVTEDREKRKTRWKKAPTTQERLKTDQKGAYQ